MCCVLFMARKLRQAAHSKARTVQHIHYHMLLLRNRSGSKAKTRLWSSVCVIYVSVTFYAPVELHSVSTREKSSSRDVTSCYRPGCMSDQWQNSVSSAHSFLAPDWLNTNIRGGTRESANQEMIRSLISINYSASSVQPGDRTWA